MGAGPLPLLGSGAKAQCGVWGCASRVPGWWPDEVRVHGVGMGSHACSTACIESQLGDSGQLLTRRTSPVLDHVVRVPWRAK